MLSQTDKDKLLSFEELWAVVQETSLQQKETDRLITKLRAEMEDTGRKMEETSRQMKETDRQIGKLGNRFGEMVEHLVSPGIIDKFNALGFHFTEESENHKIRETGNPNVSTEIDLLLENGDIAVAVEVKAKPRQADIDDHVGRMEILRRKADHRNDRRKFRGAIAGAIMEKEVKTYALMKGFYVIEQTGDTVRINIPEGFEPREW